MKYIFVFIILINLICAIDYYESSSDDEYYYYYYEEAEEEKKSEEKYDGDYVIKINFFFHVSSFLKFFS